MTAANTIESKHSLASKKEDGLWLLDAILHSYSILFFTQKKWVGACLLFATFIIPQHALLGLSSVLIAAGVAHLLGFDKHAIRDGRIVFNALLVGMTVAYLQGYHDFPLLQLGLILVTASLLSLFVSVMLNTLLQQFMHLPSMSLPFVAVSVPLFFLYFSISAVPVVSEYPSYLFAEPAWLGESTTSYFQSFGALLFIPHAGVGIFLFVCLLIHSRLSVLFTVVGFISGVLFLEGFGYTYTPESLSWVSFNFILTGIALGGGFFVPSRSSLALVVIGGFICAAIALASKTFLLHFNIPPLALPFNLVVIIMVYALRLRSETKTLFAAPHPGASPEKNFRQFYADQMRYKDAEFPVLHPPFFGERVVTQGVEGGITHREDWAFALDFEIHSPNGDRSMPAKSDNLEDYFTHNSPVLSPCNGQVVKVIKDVSDNTPGENNLQHNWGNLVIIRTELGLFVKLAHFRYHGVTVQEGDYVVAGAMLGYCGNSGRSPFPHIHLQMQRTDQVGAGSIPFRLINYQSLNDSENCFVGKGLPDEGERIMTLIADPVATTQFNNLANQSYCYEVSYNGEKNTETLSCELDPWGNYLFTSKEYSSTLTARVIDHVFTVLDISGSNASILAYALPCLTKVPLLKAKRLTWSDTIDVSSLDSKTTLFFKNILQPFAGVIPTKSEHSYAQGNLVSEFHQTKVTINTEEHWMHSGSFEKHDHRVSWKLLE